MLKSGHIASFGPCFFRVLGVEFHSGSSVLGLWGTYYIDYRNFVARTIFLEACWESVWMGSMGGRMHYYYSGDIPGALDGVDSGTILATCSSVAEFPLYPCTQTTYSQPSSVCSCVH